MPEEYSSPYPVWLVGEGKGEPELLTRKAERLLREADIVFYDAQVGAGVLALIPAHANCIPVGKRSGRHSKDQDSITDLLLSAALSGKRVRSEEHTSQLQSLTRTSYAVLCLIK